MVRRHAGASFMAGAYVFPGGKLEASDIAFPPVLLDDPSTGDLALKVAAVRETFEECGVLLAHTSSGRFPTSTELVAMESARARDRLNDRSDDWDWSEWIGTNGLTLQVARFGFLSWWITPKQEPRRFDTRFYVAAVPVEQDARHDDMETTHSAWIRPADALAIADRREALVFPPTRRNLQSLLEFDTADEAVAAIRESIDPSPIMPDLVVREDGVFVIHESFGALQAWRG